MMIIYHQHHQIQRLISIMIIVMVVFLRVITITSDINISSNANKLYIIFIIIIPYILVINPCISTNQNPPSSFIINIHLFLIIIISFNIFLIQTPLHPDILLMFIDYFQIYINLIFINNFISTLTSSTSSSALTLRTT